jgi:hypothetical protein
MKGSTGAAEPNSGVHGVETVLESADVEFIDTPPIGWETVARFLRKASKDDKIDITRTRSTILLLTRPIFGPQDPPQTAMRGTEALIMSINITLIKKKPPPPKEPDELVPLEAQDFFGAAPLIPGESALEYQALLKRVTKAVPPTDVFEEIWVRDMVYITLESLRWRRLRARMFHIYARARIQAVLTKSAADDDLLKRWARGETKASEEVDHRLAAEGLAMDDLMGDAFVANLAAVERIDRLLANIEARRHTIYREIHRHRDLFRNTLRRAMSNEEDGIEFGT